MMKSHGESEAEDHYCKYRTYITELFSHIRELAHMTRNKRLTDPTSATTADEMVEAGLLNMLILMQVQTGLCGIDRADVGMAGFDPLKDELLPERKRA